MQASVCGDFDLAPNVADVPGSLFGALALASMGKIADGKTALNTMLFVMTLSMAMAGLMTHAYSNSVMDGISWQVFVGAGIYGAYTLGNPAPVSDLVFTADLFGYVARRHSQGLAELELPFSVVVTASVIHGILA